MTFQQKICENEKKLKILQNESRPLFKKINVAEVNAWYLYNPQI